MFDLLLFCRALFPCGDGMVCIIDDREDVWHFSPNLVHVKPYRFFQGTADINAPAGLTKTEEDGKPMIHKVRRVSQSSTNSKDEAKEEDKDSIGESKDSKGESKDSKGESKDSKGESKDSKGESKDGKGDSKDGKGEDYVDTTKEIDKDNTGESKGSDEVIKKETKEPDSKSQCELVGKEVNEKAESVDDAQGEKNETELESEDKVKEDSGKKTGSETKEDISAKVGDKETDDSGGDCKTKEGTKVESEVGAKVGAGELNKPESAEDETSKKTDQSDKVHSENAKASDTSTTQEKGINEKMEVDDTNGDKENVNKTDDTNEDEEDLIEWDDEDDYLFYLEEILKTIHKTFYDFYDHMKEKEAPTEADKPDLKNIIPYIKKKVLKGCNILFSGVVPTNMKVEKSRAHMVAKALGATIHDDLRHKGNEKDSANFTTHLVAARHGTSKVRTAMKYKTVKVVNVDWLWSCTERWERVEEVLFPLTAEATDSDRNSPDPSKLSGKKSMKRKHDSDGNQQKGKGKRHKSRQADQSDSDSMDIEYVGARKAENSAAAKDKEKFAMTYNPMLAFSDDDLAFMDKEVEDEIAGEEGISSEEENSRDERIRDQVLKCKGDLDVSSSEDSLVGGDMPKGWGLKQTSPRHSSDDERQVAKEPKELSPEYESETDQDKFENIMDAFGPETENSDDNESIGSVDDEIAEAVIKEFLS